MRAWKFTSSRRSCFENKKPCSPAFTRPCRKKRKESCTRPGTGNCPGRNEGAAHLEYFGWPDRVHGHWPIGWSRSGCEATRSRTVPLRSKRRVLRDGLCSSRRQIDVNQISNSVLCFQCKH